MASGKEIRSRIASVKNTQQITKAMKMVSAAKLRRAQDRIQNMRPYAKKLLTAIADIVVSHRVSDPLLSHSAEVKKVLLVVITSDRGLCGGFNASVGKFAFNYYKKNKENFETLDLMFVGKRGADFFKTRGVLGKKTIENMAKDISYAVSSNIAEDLMHSYADGGYDEIRLVYNEFKSAIQQDLVSEKLLPVDIEESSLEKDNKEHFSKDLIFEPSAETLVASLLHKHFAIQVYRCLSESIAAEHAARMTAMENATSNAKDMIDRLTLTANKLRQASITTELMEITSGAEALKG